MSRTRTKCHRQMVVGAVRVLPRMSSSTAVLALLATRIQLAVLRPSMQLLSPMTTACRHQSRAHIAGDTSAKANGNMSVLCFVAWCRIVNTTRRGMSTKAHVRLTCEANIRSGLQNMQIGRTTFRERLNRKDLIILQRHCQALPCKVPRTCTVSGVAA